MSKYTPTNGEKTTARISRDGLGYCAETLEANRGYGSNGGLNVAQPLVAARPERMQSISPIPRDRRHTEPGTA